MSDLSVKILGLQFDNPIMPASGPLTKNYEDLMYFTRGDVGAIVTKTISSKGAIVMPPFIVADDNAVYNSELWSELNPEVWSKDILPQVKRVSKKPMIISIGYGHDDFQKLIPMLEPYADAFEVSTHYADEDLGEMVRGIVSMTDKPVLMKLSPHVQDYISFVKTIVEAGAAGVVAINSVGPGLKIDLKKREIILGSTEGDAWISGPAIKAIALHRVAHIRRHFPELPIVAAGGISNAKDVLEFLLAGADLVQILSYALIKGRKVYTDIIRDLERELNEYRFFSIEDVRTSGLHFVKRKTPEIPNVIDENCIMCGLCVAVCPNFAIEKRTKIEIDADECMRCGLCQSRCPTDAIQGVL